MDDFKEFQGKSLDEAIRAACAYFDAPREKLEIDIIQDAKNGIFGLVGARKALIRARRAQLKPRVGSILSREAQPAARPKSEEARPRTRAAQPPRPPRGNREAPLPDDDSIGNRIEEPRSRRPRQPYRFAGEGAEDARP
ncbi:Jag N-terminal domain-containing protein, partial [uncultured Bilophila sp.]|uniref:Jag N-terminal domain-containing protein n=2 Tax=uncultured Bilophila sp. TaxID=529385 RepID=UPI0026068762